MGNIVKASPGTRVTLQASVLGLDPNTYGDFEGVFISSHKHKGKALYLVKLSRKPRQFQSHTDFGWPRALLNDIKSLGEAPWLVLDESFIRNKRVALIEQPDHGFLEAAAPARECHACHSVPTSPSIRCPSCQGPICEYHLRDASQLPASTPSAVCEGLRELVARMADMGVAQADVWVCCARSYFARRGLPYDERLLNDIADWVLERSGTGPPSVPCWNAACGQQLLIPTTAVAAPASTGLPLPTPTMVTPPASGTISGGRTSCPTSETILPGMGHDTLGRSAPASDSEWTSVVRGRPAKANPAMLTVFDMSNEAREAPLPLADVTASSSWDDFLGLCLRALKADPAQHGVAAVFVVSLKTGESESVGELSALTGLRDGQRIGVILEEVRRTPAAPSQGLEQEQTHWVVCDAKHQNLVGRITREQLASVRTLQQFCDLCLQALGRNPETCVVSRVYLRRIGEQGLMPADDIIRRLPLPSDVTILAAIEPRLPPPPASRTGLDFTSSHRHVEREPVAEAPTTRRGVDPMQAKVEVYDMTDPQRKGQVTRGVITRAATWEALKSLCVQALDLDPELHQVDCVEVQKGKYLDPEIISDLPELSPATATRIGIIVQAIQRAPLVPQVGPLEPLSSLAAEYPHNQSYQHQITQELPQRGGLCSWRRIRGDGNCYYRAFMLGVFEGPPGIRADLLKLVDWLSRKPEGAEYQQELQIAAATLRGDREFDEVVRQMNDLDTGVDMALIRMARLLASTVLKSNKDRQIAKDHLTVLQYIEAQGYSDVAHFCREKVDEMGEDAEGIVLEYGPLARILGIRCHIWLLARDRTQALESITNLVDGPVKAEVHLLLVPGHYSYLSTHAAPQLSPKRPPPPPSPKQAQDRRDLDAAFLSHSSYGVVEAKGSPTPHSVRTPQSGPTSVVATQQLASPRSPLEARNGPGAQGWRLLEADMGARGAAVPKRGDSGGDMDVSDGEAKRKSSDYDDIQRRPPSPQAKGDDTPQPSSKMTGAEQDADTGSLDPSGVKAVLREGPSDSVSIVQKKIDNCLKASINLLELLAAHPETIYTKWSSVVLQLNVSTEQIARLVAEERNAAWPQLMEWYQLCVKVPAVAANEEEARRWHRQLLDATQTCRMHDL